MLSNALADVRDAAIEKILKRWAEVVGKQVPYHGLVSRLDTKYTVASVEIGGLAIQHEDSVSKIDVWHPWIGLPTDTLVELADGVEN